MGSEVKWDGKTHNGGLGKAGAVYHSTCSCGFVSRWCDTEGDAREQFMAHMDKSAAPPAPEPRPTVCYHCGPLEKCDCFTHIPPAEALRPDSGKVLGEGAWADEALECKTKAQMVTLLRAFAANMKAHRKLAEPSAVPAEGPDYEEWLASRCRDDAEFEEHTTEASRANDYAEYRLRQRDLSHSRPNDFLAERLSEIAALVERAEKIAVKRETLLGELAEKAQGLLKLGDLPFHEGHYGGLCPICDAVLALRECVDRVKKMREGK